MLVKVNNISGNSVRVTKLDIDDFGSVIPLRELDLKLPQDDDCYKNGTNYQYTSLKDSTQEFVYVGTSTPSESVF